MKSVQVYVGLSEPLYKQFGSYQIIDVMKKLGIKEDEAIELSMISNSIKKVQKKLEKGVIAAHEATSQVDWLQKNYSA